MRKRSGALYAIDVDSYVSVILIYSNNIFNKVSLWSAKELKYVLLKSYSWWILSLIIAIRTKF